MKKTILLMAVCLCFIGKASAQWVVSDPGNLAQGIINTTKQIVQTSTTAKNTLDGFMEAQKISSREKSITMRSKRYTCCQGRHQGEEVH